MKRTLLSLSVLLLACAPHHGAIPNPGTLPQLAAVAADSIPLSLRWYRGSAELQAIFIETYRAATAAVEGAALKETGKQWGVIMDADETVLDNSMYQQMRGGRGYSAETWSAWVRSKRAVSLPGALEFVRAVHALGGKVSIVTNRENNVCRETEENLRAIGFDVDQVLCKPAGTDDNKGPRFSAVQQGSAPSTLPAMDVVVWVGDNIRDFPGASQELRSRGAAGFPEVGRTWFVLPNPLYGSWDKNPVP